ncbi:DUF1622 domain-containing protein [Arthrobacter gengyunqii]|uniref:DUF1622 domain-containing protein n=1 Tax=Arthrobacter gengyunqii TaxID=2886940 RepID=A0A9X1M1E9_9MICC|nr:DUF1622 domain-containing protein [Arthrobacter gengyunqii]MCC3265868.1 DUF1622 domain-containing protein [Arthrobacter gengyunqii]MCC3268624.1 DUF1622 domain-containing protein [Arthrobacter gengyunqii]UOY96012.1 DUF1622 domain-containing protein [Arthrobacter gengyunqii]
MEFKGIIEAAGELVDLAGVAVIIIGAILATVSVLRTLLRRTGRPVYEAYRQQLGRSILLGLELLVAADIIRTVAVTPTFESLGVLALIVLIRTFLSYALQLEVTGRLPWQQARTAETAPPPK